LGLNIIRDVYTLHEDIIIHLYTKYIEGWTILKDTESRIKKKSPFNLISLPFFMADYAIW